MEFRSNYVFSNFTLKHQDQWMFLWYQELPVIATVWSLPEINIFERHPFVQKTMITFDAFNGTIDMEYGDTTRTY